MEWLDALVMYWSLSGNPVSGLVGGMLMKLFICSKILFSESSRMDEMCRRLHDPLFDCPNFCSCLQLFDMVRLAKADINIIQTTFSLACCCKKYIIHPLTLFAVISTILLLIAVIVYAAEWNQFTNGINTNSQVRMLFLMWEKV